MIDFVAQPCSRYNNHLLVALRAPIRAGLHPANAVLKIKQGVRPQLAAWLPEAPEASGIKIRLNHVGACI